MAISEATLKDTIRQRGISTTDISDVALDAIIDNALYEYSSYRPNIVFTATTGYITTVTGQPDYSFPTDAVTILNVMWQPDYSDVSLNTMYTQMMLNTAGETNAVDIIVTLNNLALFRKYFTGRWEILNNKIWLIPAPGIDGIKVAILYGKTHTLSSLNAAEDYLFYDLVFSQCMMVKSNALMSTAGWRAGAYQVSSNAGVVMQKWAQDQLNRVYDRLANASGREASRSETFNTVL